MNDMNKTLLGAAVAFALAAMAPLAQAQASQAAARAEAPTWAPETVHISARREGYAAARTSAATRTDTPLINRRVFDTYQYFAFPVVMPTQPRFVFVSIQTGI